MDAYRALLFGLTEAASVARARGAANDEIARLQQIHYRLLRLWADC